MPALNIQILVDVVALLSESGIDKSIFMYDDSPQPSINLGTAKLRSPVYPGQLVRWAIVPIDIQTPCWLVSLTFGTNAPPPPAPAPLWARDWEGTVPFGLDQADHPYTMTLGFSNGQGTRQIPVMGPALFVDPDLATGAARPPVPHQA